MEAQNNQVHLAEGDGQHGPAQSSGESFTPGPWTWYDDTTPAGKNNRHEIVALGKTICHIYTSVPHQDSANARLIAAAPDLLVALQLAEAYLSERVAGTGGLGETRVLPRVRAALARAGGAA